MKANKKTAFEDCFGKPYQGVVTKFAEAALFRFAVSFSGRVRSEVRQGRADARFVRGIRLGKNVNSDEHLLATDGGVYMTRTVKRVPETEQRRVDLVKSCQGSLWDWVAMRPAGRPRKAAPQAPPVATPPAATATERPSDDASERCSTEAQDLIPPVVPHVTPALRAEEKENEPGTASGATDTDRGGASVDPAPSSPDVQTHPSGKRTQPADQPEQPPGSSTSGVKRDARAAELPDEDEGGGKFQQVEGLTTVDADPVRILSGRRLRGRRDR